MGVTLAGIRENVMSQMKRAVEVAIGVIEWFGKVLICRRSEGGVLAGYWEFPGGKCEPGETVAQCLARELLEELGIEVAVTHTFDPIEHQYPTVHVRLYPFLCALTGAEPRPIECEEMRWVTPAELRSYRLPEANAELIQSVIEKLA